MQRFASPYIPKGMGIAVRVAIGTIALGGIYPQLSTRLLQRFAAVCPNYEVQAWINNKPAEAPFMFVDEYDYTAYCAKPFVMDALRADVAILLDASFFPVRDILPLVEHIEKVGYYFCDNEFKVGEWCSDKCAEAFGLNRDYIMDMPELSSYCVGLDLRRGECRRLLEMWKSAARSPSIIPGRHTAGTEGRNAGFVSSDSRVRGHRHDQTALSIIAHQFGMHYFVKRPILTAYAAIEWNKDHLPPTEETVLVNWGEIRPDV